MTQFIKITSNGGYHLVEGMEGCIVPTSEILGSLAVVHAPALGLYCKQEHKHLAKPKMFNGSDNNYYFSESNYERVDNPFAHWNSLKSGNLH